MRSDQRRSDLLSNAASSSGAGADARRHARVIHALLEQRRDAYRLRRISLTARMQYAELTELAEAANLLILDEAAKEPALNSHFANPFRLQGGTR